ncbi:MAG TPA: sigma-54-dependent Fis family transcriptional regulator [Candidatus Acidoferrales bacterium]|nr:sigma-54-dependent Fis family transcriptional regulator [Candidatus Acidoferrales bacterium]
MAPTPLEKERDLYLRLLNLGRVDELRPLLQEALALIVEVTEARQGYLELNDLDDRGSEPRWWMAHGFSSEEVESVRGAISGGIIAESIATGRTIVTQSALEDPRFSERQSVRVKGIAAVLCAPIGAGQPRGVLYLQGRAARGPFTEEDRWRADVFAFHLAPLVDRVMDRERVREGSDPTRALRKKLQVDHIVGHSAALAAVFKEAALVAPLDVNVMLTGESGTGKSQLARAIHASGPRAGQPFVEVNCATIPENLAEQELFGAAAGAHSTATKAMPGKVIAAEHGTLFLDEVGTLSMPVQAKLLQLIQSLQYYPLGSVKPIQADVRIIAATNTDLRQAVAENKFREDLFFRLNVLPIRLPSLAERREDVPALARSLCASACERFKLPHLTLSPGAIEAAQAAEWPGNIRELQHAIEAAAIRAAGENSKQIERQHLFPQAAMEGTSSPEPQTFQEATRRFHEQLLRRTLEETNWNVAETARRLDLARSHVYTLINGLGIKGQS